jgi:hypothetical protein
MDEAVLRAIAKWPNVPSVYGWLALDRRGNWAIKGERIANGAIVEFIGRNYAADQHGRWFFQNGPQRVFVTLAYTPLVYRLEQSANGAHTLVTHSGMAGQTPFAGYVDETGALLLECPAGIGLVLDRDLAALEEALTDAAGAPMDESALQALMRSAGDAMRSEGATMCWGDRRLPVRSIRAREVAPRFGFDPDPRPAPGEPEC